MWTYASLHWHIAGKAPPGERTWKMDGIDLVLLVNGKWWSTRFFYFCKERNVVP